MHIEASERAGDDGSASAAIPLTVVHAEPGAMH